MYHYVLTDNACYNCDAESLKSVSGWNDNGNGTDYYGFSALPGGGSFNGDFYHVGNSGYLWSASEYDSDDAYYKMLGYDAYTFNYWHIGGGGKNALYSVRCIQDM
jgi:uncharacterized protein (TIGR02145 family)